MTIQDGGSGQSLLKLAPLLCILCFAMPSQAYVVQVQQGEPEGTFIISMVGEALEGYPKPVTQFSMYINVAEKEDKSRSYAFDLRYVDDPSWMISIKRGKSLTLFIDGEKVEFVTLSDPWRTSGVNGMNGGASYSTTPEIIRKISEAKSVKVRIKASNGLPPIS